MAKQEIIFGAHVKCKKCSRSTLLAFIDQYLSLDDPEDVEKVTKGECSCCNEQSEFEVLEKHYEPVVFLYSEGDCPLCGENIIIEPKRQKHCPECGKDISEYLMDEAKREGI